MNAIQNHQAGHARVAFSDLTNYDALLKRANRSKAMRQAGQTLRACSSHSRDRAELGAFYIINTQGIVVATHVDLERMARDLGVLRPDDVAQSPLSMTLDQAEALLYEARERLQDAHGFGAERALRQEVEEAQTRVNLLRATQARAAA